MFCADARSLHGSESTAVCSGTDDGAGMVGGTPERRVPAGKLSPAGEPAGPALALGPQGVQREAVAGNTARGGGIMAPIVKWTSKGEMAQVG